MPDDLVLPSRIPWNQLKGKELEETLNWLLDSLGAKDLEWRVGGSGAGTADGGRDLAAAFYAPGPDEELARQLWWIEAKGRGQTVEPSAVKEAVLNAAGKSEVDVLVVATNQVFSNPTRDWVAEWQREHRRPMVRLWDRNALERLVSKHPSVAIRLFAEALSDQGRVEVVRSAFWNNGFLTGERTLARLWEARARLSIGSLDLLALQVSEAAYSDLASRPWALMVPDTELANALSTGVANGVYLYYRLERASISYEPFVKAMAYLLLILLSRHPANVVESIIEDVWSSERFADAPKAARELSVHSFVQVLERQPYDVCTSDCGRVISDRLVLSREQVERFWDRLHPPAAPSGSKEPLKDEILVIESHNESCKVGFSVDEERRCPFRDEREFDLSTTLKTLHVVIQARNPYPRHADEGST